MLAYLMLAVILDAFGIPDFLFRMKMNHGIAFRKGLGVADTVGSDRLVWSMMTHGPALSDGRQEYLLDRAPPTRSAANFEHDSEGE